jgi:hypothetical protein
MGNICPPNKNSQTTQLATSSVRGTAYIENQTGGIKQVGIGGNGDQSYPLKNMANNNLTNFDNINGVVIGIGNTIINYLCYFIFLKIINF